MTIIFSFLLPSDCNFTAHLELQIHFYTSNKDYCSQPLASFHQIAHPVTQRLHTDPYYPAIPYEQNRNGTTHSLLGSALPPLHPRSPTPLRPIPIHHEITVEGEFGTLRSLRQIGIPAVQPGRGAYVCYGADGKESTSEFEFGFDLH